MGVGESTLSNPSGSTRAAIDIWRAALVEDLFGEAAGLPLYLFLEPERFEAIAQHVGSDGDRRAAFARAVGDQMEWQGDQWRRWREQARAWEAAGKVGAPPFVDLLVLLTFAAENMVADDDHAAHNYYARLSALLGLDGPRADRLRRVFSETVWFWQALNDWLEEWEGERGWPTARAYDRRKYIGYPLSQALVREQDRRSLHAAFERYNLQPMRRMGAAEMIEILSDWVARRAAPGNLIRLWTDRDARRRIAEIACAELSHWGGGATHRQAGGAHDAAGRTRRLEWMAELSLAPVAKLELFLIARGASEDTIGSYHVGERRTDAAGHAAVEGAQNLRFELFPGMRWASLEPWAQIGVTSLFSGVLELIDDDDPERSFLRSPAPILVLEAEGDRIQFLEVPRVQLFKPALVLAHASNAGLIEGHLRANAREGWRKFAAEELQNLPVGWVAFTDVLMIKPVEENRVAKLEPLCAGSATVIEFSGGLQLGHGVWHLRRPPEVMASVDSGDGFSLTIAARNAGGEGALLGAYFGRAVVQLGAASVGDHEIALQKRLSSGVRTLDVVSLRLRTGDVPKPVGVRDGRDERYELSAPTGLFSLSSAFDPIAANLRGCLLENAATLPGGVPVLRAPELALRVRPPRPDHFQRRAARVDDERFAQSCAVRAHHIWDCEPGRPGDDYRTLKYQRCQTCHREEWTRNRGVRRAGAPAPQHAQRQVRTLSPVPRYRPRTQIEAGGYDLLLDALTYLTSGSADRFRSLARDINPEEGFAWKAANLFAGLGHVDLEMQAGRLRGWRVSPSGLVETSDGAWALAGARSALLLATLRTWATERGYGFDVFQMAEGPALVRLQAPTISALPSIDVVSPLGQPLYVAKNWSRRLLGALPGLQHALSALPEFKIGGDAVEWFDLDAHQWSPAEGERRVGAFRVDFRGLNYGFAGAADVERHIMRVGDAALVKHLAAAAAGQSLVHYDKDRAALLTPLGAGLPGLLERAAIMCSGKAPRYRSDAGLIEYDDVPVDIATLIQNKLHA